MLWSTTLRMVGGVGSLGLLWGLIWIAGFKYTAANIAALLNQTNTILVVVWAMLFLGERLTLRSGAAVALACAGSVLVLV